jgi:hypothetical protein
MIKKYLTLPILLATLFAASQKAPSSNYKKKRISQTDIKALFSYYNQEGDHSAITAGVGTEKLLVKVTELEVKLQPDSINMIDLGAGVDVITSASRDNIDYQMSSASKHDMRWHISAGYSRVFNKKVTTSIGSGLSIESDYASLPISFSISRANLQKSTEISASLNCFFDDLRWGRLSWDYRKPVKLIYPYELRYKEWFSIYGRNSYNLQLAYYRAINKKLQLSVYPEAVYQHGLLSTPYHRVFFNTRDERVENLPLNRWKFPFAIQLNSYAADHLILKLYYRFYIDNWGINAHTFQVDAPIEISKRFTLNPLLRLYTQTESDYFRRYGEHSPDESFYTSDHDLSSFFSYKLGMGFRFRPEKSTLNHYTFHEVELRYSFYHRSDELSAHIISLLMEIKHSRADHLKQ